MIDNSRKENAVNQIKKPLISILLATYEPRMNWLKQQLESLNNQTYPFLKLYICDDGSKDSVFEEIKKMVAACITSFPYYICRNNANKGSNATFERLTRSADGEFYAYCDQDDIWLPEKLEVLQKHIESENVQLVCSDMFIINSDGRRIADSMTKVRRHHVFRSGYSLAEKLLVSNWVTGCATLIRADTAKNAVPFCPFMVHDHYLALIAAERGKILCIPDQLLNYRIHGDNQTLMMNGVYDKDSYFHLRIELMLLRMEWLRLRFVDNSELTEKIEQVQNWAEARKDYFLGDRKAWKRVMRHYRLSPFTSLFECAMAHGPEWMFMWIVELKRRNYI